MDKKQSDPEIEDVIREETSRGRRPIDLRTQRQRQQLLRGLKKLLEHGTEDEFVAAMRALGLGVDSPSFREALRIWRENRS